MRTEEVTIATAVLGTANLFGLLDDERSARVLRAALDAGFTSFDTAPSYGFGVAEAALGRLVAGREGITVTTKVGLEAPRRRARPLRAVRAVGRRLPRPLRDRLRARQPPDPNRFTAHALRASVDRSLRRLGHVDVLLLHEVRPEEVDEELLTELSRLQESGDVGAVGVGTQNDLTVLCLDRGGGLFTYANVSVAPDASPVVAPAAAMVGHGALGPGGSALRRLSRTLLDDPAAKSRWSGLVSGTPYDGADGLVRALLGRALATGVTGLVLTSSRPERLAASRTCVESGSGVPPEVRRALRDLWVVSSRRSVP